MREGATLKPPHFCQSQFHTGPEGDAPLVTPQFCQIQKFPQVSLGVVSMTTPQFCVSSSSSPTSLTDSHHPTRLCTTVSTPSPPDQNVADPTTVDVIHLRPGSSSSLCTRLTDLGYSSGVWKEGILGKARAYFVDASDQDQEQALHLLQHLEGQHHWAVLGVRDGPACQHALCQQAQVRHFRYDVDGCYFGLPTKRPLTLISTSPFMTALRWKCCQEVFPHVHGGKRAFHSELPAEFFDLLAYCFACALDGHARLLVPRGHHPQLLHLRHLPCDTHSSDVQNPAVACGKLLLCSCKHLCVCGDQCLQVQQMLAATSFTYLPGPEKLALPHLEVPLPPRPDMSTTSCFKNYRTWKADKRKRPAGTPVILRFSKRLRSGYWAAAAGLQMRRTAALPLYRLELEPGEAIVEAALRPHPFTVEPDLPPHLMEAIALVAGPPQRLQQLRAHRLRHWVQRAHQLLPRTLCF